MVLLGKKEREHFLTWRSLAREFILRWQFACAVLLGTLFCLGQRQKKVFFSEEKKQKTFSYWCMRQAGHARQMVSVFGSFLQQ
jgi:hypothetical protein